MSDEGGKPAGPILDELGVTLDLDDDDRVVEVLVLAKTVAMGDGTVGLVVADSGIDWIAQRGLIAAAQEILAADPPLLRGGED